MKFLRKLRQFALGALWLACISPVFAQVNQERAAEYFKEAEAICSREGGRLWGVSLCGPVVIADGVTRTIATNQPPPDAPRPTALGFANAAMNWGGVRWATVAWQTVPHADPRTRARLMMHELFHRIQLQLGLLGAEGQNEHLDTRDGRYWLQLEWRALARALAASGAARGAALSDALAFRAARHKLFPAAAENERRMEINEGLAQYTGTVVAFETAAEARADAIAQLEKAPGATTFVRTFAYPTGAAYGILLDAFAPGWNRKVTVGDDLAVLARGAAAVEPVADAAAAADSYGASSLRAAEAKREEQHRAYVAELRRRFVEGPVLILPRPRNPSFVTSGITPIPGEGRVFPGYRTVAEWGTLEAKLVLVAADMARLAVPAPASTAGTELTGDGWKLTLAAGWVVRPGPRAGDFQLQRADDPPKPQE